MLWWPSLAVILLVATRWGGWAERYGALCYGVAALATIAARSPWATRYATVELGVMMVDAALLLALLILTARSRRIWPIIAAALQTIAFLSHVAKVLDPGLWRLPYALMSGATSYPMLITLAIGSWSHHRMVLHKRTLI